MGANGECRKCGAPFVGDGFTAVLHCPNAEPEKVDYCEPDANPVLCDFHEDSKPNENPSFIPQDSGRASS